MAPGQRRLDGGLAFAKPVEGVVKLVLIDLAEAEFYAGWIALQRMHDPVLAEQHFAVLSRLLGPLGVSVQLLTASAAPIPGPPAGSPLPPAGVAPGTQPTVVPPLPAPVTVR